MKKFVEMFRGVQRGNDVLEKSRLGRAGLIDRGFSHASGSDSCMICVLGEYHFIIYGTWVLRHHRVLYLVFLFFVSHLCVCNI